MENIPKGYKKTKVGIIPKEWEVVRLGEVAYRISKKNTKSIIKKVFSNSANNGIIIQNEYFNKDIANKNNLSGYYIVEKGDFVYNPRISKYAPAGPINQNSYPFSGIVSPLYTVFRIKNDKHINFLKYFFKSNLWLRYMQSIANYGARHDRMNITNSSFMKMPIPLPPLPEQKKIAKILITWDRAIEKLKALIREKERLKKGLMQRLLSGKVRFKEFKEEWKEVRLGEVGNFFKGKGISKKDISDNGIECIRYGELYTKYNETIKRVFSKTSLNKDKLFLSKKNDVLIPASGETATDLATASCILKKDVAIGGDINILRTKLNGIFLSFYLNVVAKNKIASLAQGVSVIHLYSSQLKNLYIPLPPLSEQKKIAKVLTTADKEIELLKRELKALEEQKKGLMQKLLTGEIKTNNIKEIE